jgi:hypothetical protein
LAVPAECIAAVEAELRRRGLKYHNLSIGGVGVRDGERKIDFIDRRLYHATLFQEAIEAAARDRRVVSVGRVKLPLVSAEYLVAMKMVSGESKDDRDAKRLLEHVKLIDDSCARAVCWPNRRLRRYPRREPCRSSADINAHDSATPLVPSRMILDFGIVPQASRQRLYFELQNPSDRPVVVDRIESDCDCVTIALASHPLAPGGSVLGCVILDLTSAPEFVGRLATGYLR